MTVHHLDAEGLERLQDLLRSELEHHPDIAFAYLFGSVLNAVGFRDVDVAIWTVAGSSPAIDLELAGRLTERSGLPIDVRRVNDAPSSFVFHAVRGRLLVVNDERLLADVIERTAREYHDLAPLRIQAVREAFSA
jgi:predicted nucleotidyltransferase